MPASRRLRDYTMFVSFFPELVAGPIVRASVFLPQMQRSLRLSWDRAKIGIPLILVGVTKKLLVADRLAIFVDPVFRTPAVFSGRTIATAVVAYSLQIYCDFSGYTDIAIGVAKIIGFDLPENFNMPYLARSITEFWRRWHITLSEWLRDYLYIPLGGNRRGTTRTYINLMLTMLLGGLWHGASWTFIVWGLLHGVGLAVHKLWVRHRPNIPVPRFVGPFVGWALTYTFVCVGWVFFRAPSLASAGEILAQDRRAVGRSLVVLPAVLDTAAACRGGACGRSAARRPARGKRRSDREGRRPRGVGAADDSPDQAGLQSGRWLRGWVLPDVVGSGALSVHARPAEPVHLLPVLR